MSLNIRLLREEECETFQEIHDASFLTQAKFFKDGILPGFEDEGEEEYDVANLLKKPGYTVLSIRDDDLLVGGSIVEAKGNHEYEIFEFFIGAEHQGRGIGKEALRLVEDYFGDAKVFRLVTPSQVVRNCAFYVNKCGYRIVKVIGYNEKENCADFLFEKTKKVGIDEVYGIRLLENAASGRVLEKCGFQTYYTGEGAYHDGAYEISKSVWTL